MFGPRLNTIFASRWRALWFAGSTLLLAYCTVPAPDEESPKPAQSAVVAQTSNAWMLGGAR